MEDAGLWEWTNVLQLATGNEKWDRVFTPGPSDIEQIGPYYDKQGKKHCTPLKWLRNKPVVGIRPKKISSGRAEMFSK